MKKQKTCLTATTATLCAIVGTVGAQPVVDGYLDSGGVYSGPLATQKSSVINITDSSPAKVTFQSDLSNVGGKGIFLTVGTQSGPNDSDPTLVTTGIELAIKLADLPGSGVGGQIKIAGFVNGSGHDFLSNQIFGGLQADPDNLGEPRNVDFSALAGDQFITVDTTVRSGTAAVVDGVRDAAYPNQVPAQVTLGTGFGNNNRTDGGMPPAGLRNRANGSEIDGVYAYIYDNGTPADPTDDILNLLVAGNVESNFNKLDLFFDVAVGGQQTLVATNPNVDFDGLNRMGTNLAGENTAAPTTLGPGLTFDTGVAPDVFISVTTGGGIEPAPPEVFVNSATLLTGGGGAGGFFGGGATGVISDTPGFPVSGTVAGGLSADAITVDADQSNSAGVTGSGGVGARVPLPGGGTQADTSDPALVQTGIEFKVNLAGIGFDTTAGGTISIAGIIMGFNWDFGSNQAIGGLTSLASPDPFHLGFPPSAIDFNTWDGNQFVSITVPPPASIQALPVGAAVDGTNGSSASETAAYGAAKWVNTTNASSFGDGVATMTFTPDANQSNGSELDAFYCYVANDPATGEPTLFGMATGNIHDFNKLVLFFDTKAGGQNVLRGDNPAPGTNFNGMAGMTFDTGFEPDHALAYEAGINTAPVTPQPEHFANSFELNTNGGGFGGSVGGGLKNGATTPITGTVLGRTGFGNNTFPPLPGIDPVDPFATFNRGVLANGTELDAVYLHVDTLSNTLFMFIAGNLEDNNTNIEIFFDTVPGSGQNTLIFDATNPQDPLYNGNPDEDFGALNRMGGPVLDMGGAVLNPGLTFDTGFDPDKWVSLRITGFTQFAGSTIPGDGNVTIAANFARLRTLSDPVGPLPATAHRFLGTVINDALFGPTVFTNGDQPETIWSAALANQNLGGIGGGQHFFCIDGTETNPTTVITGVELAMDLNDLMWDGVSQMKFMVLVSAGGHGQMANQTLPHACIDDPGEIRDVDFNTIPGNQFISFPTPSALPAVCTLFGDANGDFIINFADVLSVLGNWLTAGPTGDANGDGIVNFNDVLTALGNFGGGGTCTP